MVKEMSPDLLQTLATRYGHRNDGRLAAVVLELQQRIATTLAQHEADCPQCRCGAPCLMAQTLTTGRS